MKSTFKIFGRFILIFIGFLFVLSYFFVLSYEEADAAVMSVSPSTGTFEVGSTFDVNLMLNTEGATINTIRANLRFPADILQVTGSGGTSIIGIWTTSPRFDNANGIVELTGGIQDGINTSQGLIITLTFRVNRPGTAFFRYTDESAALLHDGHGTQALRQTQNGVYQLILPPPQGPIVASETHSDQTRWYRHSSPVLNWTHDDSAQGYSYVLDQEPITIPDNISQGTGRAAVYRNLADGTYFFHIKALRGGMWGGTTHFAIHIDTTPPAEFDIEITPSRRTSVTRPLIHFSTTDQFSGVDRYEIKIVPLSISAGDSFQQFFIETSSPYSPPELELGSYDVIVRAYDKAGNYREVTKRLEISTPLFRAISDQGIEIGGRFLVHWLWVFIIMFIVLTGSALIAWLVFRRHHRIHEEAQRKEIPPDVQQQLQELQNYRQKYGKIVAIFLVFSALFFSGGDIFAQTATEEAQSEEVLLAPPIITTVSRNITNRDIFYVGGRVEAANTEIILFLQDMSTGETLSRISRADAQGEWFYRHDSFVSAGRYVLWAQSRLGEQMSPPSPQVQITVHRTALQIGSARINYEAFYLTLLILVLAVNAGLIGFIWHHRKHARRKHAKLQKEISEVEQSIHRGFAVLRRDIEAELETIKKAKVGKGLSEELKEREKELLHDLDAIERKIGKEIWDVEKAENLG